jgi:hypothetical protein
MSGLNYYTYFFDDYNTDGFTVPNPNYLFFDNAEPSITGTINSINQNWWDFGIDTESINSNFSIKINGSFFAPMTGTYTFTFFDSYANDDLSVFYIGDSVFNPTSENANNITYYYSNPSEASYSILLTENTYYPLLIYFGQSYGGFSFVMNMTLPDGTTTTDGSGLFYTTIQTPPAPPTPPESPSFNLLFVNSMNQPLFTNNAQIYYKPASLSSSIGGVRNARRKSRYT